MNMQILLTTKLFVMSQIMHVGLPLKIRFLMSEEKIYAFSN